jgi:hypothetical protein
MIASVFFNNFTCVLQLPANTTVRQFLLRASAAVSFPFPLSYARFACYGHDVVVTEGKEDNSLSDVLPEGCSAFTLIFFSPSQQRPKKFYPEEKKTGNSLLHHLRLLESTNTEGHSQSLNYLVTNFSELIKYGLFAKIRHPEILEKLLKSDELAADEWSVYTALLQWGKFQAAENKVDYRSVIAPFVHYVRFPLFRIHQLAQVEEGLLSSEDLVALFRYSALPSGHPDREDTNQISFKFNTSRRSGGLTFEYSYNWDMKGLLSYLGTKGFTQAWQNPYLSDEIDILAQSDGTQNSSTSYYPLPAGTSTDNKLILSWAVEQQNTTNTVVSCTAAPWFTLDLKERKFIPNRITIRSCYPGSYIWDWTLSGSNDNISWIDLVNNPNPNNGADQSNVMLEINVKDDCPGYRFFKIHKSSSQTLLSGWEMYGQLIIS